MIRPAATSDLNRSPTVSRAEDRSWSVGSGTELIRKAVVAQFLTEMFEEVSGDHLDLLVTEHCRAHPWTALGIAEGPLGLRQLLPLLVSRYRDPKVFIEYLNAYGDTVAVRYRVEAETADPLRPRAAGRDDRMAGILIARMEGERIAEYWCDGGPFAFLQRRGGIPSRLSVAAV
jgi:hypothetical protein